VKEIKQEVKVEINFDNVPLKAIHYLKKLCFVLLLSLTSVTHAQDSITNFVVPKYIRAAYGEDPQQFVDFYKAESKNPTPLLVYIHGGAWSGGSASGIIKSDVFGKHNQHGEGIQELLNKGISVASVEYRFVNKAKKAGVKPPVSWPMLDAARAIQFIRSKSQEWNIDKTRIGATGSSAGGCTSLWLAMHSDMADKNSSDPIDRESTRMSCVGVLNAQSTLDPQQLFEWFVLPRYGGHAFGFVKYVDNKQVSDMDACLAARDSIMPWIKEYSPIEWASSDDPPICLVYTAPPQKKGDPQTDSVHGAAFGVHLKEKLDSLGVESYLIYPNCNESNFPDHLAFLVKKLL
jgi:acetyl esterase/lipase